jgi:membrane protein DedA with SNARE-associated domain
VYRLSSEVIPSFVLVLMGSIDCLTTVIGVLYFGAVELNPFMAGVVNTNILAFMAIKMAATFLIGFTYILATRTLKKAVNKETRSYKYSHSLLKVAYAGLVMFLIVVVVNNLMILLS